MNEYFKKLYKIVYGNKITKDLAFLLVKDLPGGEFFSYNEALNLGRLHGMNFDDVDPAEYYLILNTIYRKHCTTATKLRHDKDFEFYTLLAYDWFYDPTAKESKTLDYFL